MGTKALFLDRDGIFNEVFWRDGVVTSPRDWSEIRYYEGLDGLKEIKRLGYRLILVTNQPDVERGIVPESFLESLHGYYQKKYELDAVYVCPFSSNQHPWKKPNPGMFLQAARDFSLVLSECYHLGDTDRDVGAAHGCGCRSLLWDRPYNRDLSADFRVSSLDEVRAILSGSATTVSLRGA